MEVLAAGAARAAGETEKDKDAAATNESMFFGFAWTWIGFAINNKSSCSATSFAESVRR